MQRDIIGKLVRSSLDTNSCINVANTFIYLLERVRLDRVIRKACKSKLYEAVMYDL